MKNKIKTVLLFVTLLAVMSLPFNSYATSVAPNLTYNSDYEITDYDINIVVNEDNSLDVTESITADFYVPKHGIFRYIPYVNNIRQEDGSYKKVKSKVRGIKVNGEFDTYNENDNCVIQIGDADVTLTGKQSYIISYTFDMGREVNEGFDALYYNIIGTGWDTSISNVSFTVEMPNNNFDESKLEFHLGKYGTENSDGVTYSVEDNIISGTVDRTLSPNEALTVTLFLDEGYFTFNYALYYFSLALMIVIPFAALIIVIVLWKKYGKDKKIVDVIEFYPPEGLNSAQVALWNKGTADNNDTIGLLIELANEGYLDIEEINKKGLLKSYDCRIIRKKSTYSGQDKYKRIFFDGLFKSGCKDSVLLSDLENEFYKTVNAIKDILNDDITKVFNSKSLYLRFAGWIASIVSIVICCFICNTLLGGSERILCCAIGVLLAVIAFIVSFFIRQRTDEGHELKQKINGLRIFLETAEQDRIELLVNENPKYFYDILPFAYVLGVSDKWIKNFEGLSIERPDWYYGNEFTYMTMYHFMHHGMAEVSKTMVSVPDNDGSTGGGFSTGSGGGFAGGGFGGGGGGSW